MLNAVTAMHHESLSTSYGDCWKQKNLEMNTANARHEPSGTSWMPRHMPRACCHPLSCSRACNAAQTIRPQCFFKNIVKGDVTMMKDDVNEGLHALKSRHPMTSWLQVTCCT